MTASDAGTGHDASTSGDAGVGQDTAAHNDTGVGQDTAARNDTGVGQDMGTGVDAAGARDAGQTAPPGESCSNAIEISSGDTVRGSTVGAADNHHASCYDVAFGQAGEYFEGSDVVYTFTLEEASGVRISAYDPAQSFDVVFYLLPARCQADDVIESSCTDFEYADVAEEFSAAVLDAGTYFIVVETFDVQGTFELTLEVERGGMCVDDQFEPNDVAEASVGAGAEDIDTADLGDPETPGPDPVTLTLCEGVDYFWFGHMGGDLGVVLRKATGDGTLAGTLYHADLETRLDDQGPYDVLVQGAQLGTTAYTGAAERGLYLLVVSGAGIGQTGVGYTFALTHACVPDTYDSVLTEEDDEDAARAQVLLLQPAAEPIARALCATDKDAFILQNVVAGDIVATVAGGAGLSVEVGAVSEGEEGEVAVAPYAAYTATPSGDDLIITMAAAPVGKYVHVLSGGTLAPTTPVAYTYNATFAGIATAPANDLCAGAEVVAPSPEGVDVWGRTLGASNTVIGSCNGDLDAVEIGSEGASDVFYTFELAAATSVEALLDGGGTGFSGSLSLFGLPEQCPADMADLEPIVVNDAPVCREGDPLRLRLADLAAGGYLLVVDGVYYPPTQIFDTEFPEYRSEGAFTLTVKTYPDGFPPAAACVAATAAVIPSPGSTTTLTADTTDLPNELMAFSCARNGGRGNEVVYTLTPEANVSVVIQASGFDTVMELRAGCEDGSAVVTCNDDNTPPGDYGSQITAALTAGVTYYLVVDGYTGYDTGALTVTIAVSG